MKIIPFKHYNMWHILPVLSVTYETNHYLSIDTMWGKWGISIIIKDK